MIVNFVVYFKLLLKLMKMTHLFTKKFYLYLIKFTSFQDDKAEAKIKDCYMKYNHQDREHQSERSLCAIEMKSFMFAAVDSETCLRRSMSSMNFNPSLFCDPLGDRNIHWPVGPMTDDVKSVVMVVARQDANSLYENLMPGAGTTVTGLVTLLATATYLHHLNVSVSGKILNFFSFIISLLEKKSSLHFNLQTTKLYKIYIFTDTNVVFSLLNGEAFDYIGSSRLVYDLQRDSFTSLGGRLLKFNQISSVIELGQLGEGQLFMHSNNFKDSSLIKNLETNLNANILENSIPPASVQSFLKANSSLPAVVLANHGEKFVNKYYNSLLDDAVGLSYNSR